MRLALYQGPRPLPDGQPEDVRDAYVAAIAAAADTARPAGLLICPEMSATGYNIGARAAAALAEPPDGPIFQRLGGV
ncbi:MAG: Carbon-nitrogen hydrolase, partial [Frankiales bacterium]|nr:Carbon-nitrogen hydrolase [Frankiales bacterium]